MKWKKEELEKYVQAKEYIDTILLPVIPFRIGDDVDATKGSFQNELMNIFSNEVERELSGRVMLVPNYYYLKKADKNIEVERLNTWFEETMEQPFKHVFPLTFDAGWKKHEKKLNGNLLWIPAIETTDIKSKNMMDFIRNQTTQVADVLRTFWEE